MMKYSYHVRGKVRAPFISMYNRLSLLCPAFPFHRRSAWSCVSHLHSMITTVIGHIICKAVGGGGGKQISIIIIIGGCCSLHFEARCKNLQNVGL